MGLAVFMAWGLADGVTAALPGDGFYPVKQAFEPAWSVVDGDVAARHRLDEVTLIALGGASPHRVAAALEDARAAVEALAADHPLRAQLAEVEGWLEPVVAQA